MLSVHGMGEREQYDLVSALVADYLQADLSSEDRVMLGYAVKLTEAPASVGQADVEQLRAAGFDDRGIHDICAITAYFAFVNRIADGLGVEMESVR
jgi:uncharacterized peroxidase-related enzyme